MATRSALFDLRGSAALFAQTSHMHAASLRVSKLNWSNPRLLEHPPQEFRLAFRHVSSELEDVQAELKPTKAVDASPQMSAERSQMHAASLRIANSTQQLLRHL